MIKDKNSIFRNAELLSVAFIILANAVVELFFLIYYYNFVDFDNQYIYKFADMIADGYRPYKDFNMLQTPLSLYFVGFLFKIRRDFHIIEICVFISKTLTSIAAYQILKLKGADKTVSLVCVFAWNLVTYEAVYTYSGLFFLLLTYYMYAEYCQKDNKLLLAEMALSAALCFYSKQNIGAMALFLAGTCILYRLFKKERIKHWLASALIFVSLYAVCMLAGILIMAIQGNIKEFFEYTVFGISDFSHTEYALEHYALYLAVFFVGVVLLKKKDFELVVLSLAASAVAYPLLNFSHISAASVGMVIYLAYAIRL